MRYTVSPRMFDALDALARNAGTIDRGNDASVSTLRAMSRTERKWVDLTWGNGIVKGRDAAVITGATMRRAGWTTYRDACKERGVQPAGQAPDPRPTLASRMADMWAVVADVNGPTVALPF